MTLGFAMLLLLAVLCGCGGPHLVPVSGRVTLNGEPLAGALISFEPVHGTSDETSIATADAEGRYQLRCFSNDRLGAIPGKHRVMITTVVSADSMDERSRLPQDRVPARYQDGSLTFDVDAEGNDRANFDLESRP